MIEPFSLVSPAERNCDAVTGYFTHAEISRIASHNRTADPGLALTNMIFDENGAYDEAGTILRRWSDFSDWLQAEGLISWDEIVEFYKSNQGVINDTFCSSRDFQILHEGMARELSIEQGIVGVAVFAIYNWCFGADYRKKRLAAEATREREAKEKLDDLEREKDLHAKGRNVHCSKCGAFIGISDSKMLISAVCQECDAEEKPMEAEDCRAKDISTVRWFKRLILFLKKG